MAFNPTNITQWSLPNAPGPVQFGYETTDTVTTVSSTTYFNVFGNFNNYNIMPVSLSVGDLIQASCSDGIVQLRVTAISPILTAVDNADILPNTITTAMIQDGAVTYPKIQNVTATDRLLGRSTAGAGVVEEIVATAQARALLDDATQLAQAQTILNNVAVTAATVAGTDKILGLDVDDSGALKSFTAQSIADLAPTVTFPITLAQGGTNANLTANDGGIFYSTATAGAILAGTATAAQMLQSGATAAPTWSTSTWPTTTTANQILYSSAGNTVTGLATANDGILVTSAAGVPSISTAIPNGVTATTQAPSTNNTTVATTAYTDAAVAASSPAGITAAPPIYTFASDATQGAEIRMMEDTDGGVNYFARRAPAAMSSNVTIIEPTALTSGINFYCVTSSTGQASLTNFSSSVIGSINNRDAVILTNSNGVSSSTSGIFLHPINVPGANYYYSPIGCRGINTAVAGITATNDTIYAFPIYIPSNLNKIAIGIETADAGGTADIDVNFYGMTSGATFTQAGERIGTTATISNIATNGVKTVTFAGLLPLGGYYWLAIRPDNITTSLVLSSCVAVDDSQSYLFFGVGSDYTTPTPIYGVQYNSQTSFPTSLASTAPSAIITTPIGMCIYV